jgi:hypothetical protein
MVVRRSENERMLSSAPTHLLLSTAADIVRQCEERSSCFDQTAENEVPRFKLEGWFPLFYATELAYRSVLKI